VNETTIRHPLPCSRCGYDLEGLAARGRCPECGQAVLDSLVTQVDVESATLAPTTAIRRTSTVIFLIALGAFGGSSPFLAVLLTRVGNALALDASVLDSLATTLRAITTGSTLIGALGALLILPWTRERNILRPRILGVFGFLMWCALAQGPMSDATAPLSTLPLIVVLLALAPLLQRLGPRCHAYRNARATAQRIDGLVISTAIAGAASLGSALLDSGSMSIGGLGEDISLFLTIIATAAGGLTVLGLAYLMLNAIWIIRAAGHPLLTVDEAFGTQARAPGEQISRETHP